MLADVATGLALVLAAVSVTIDIFLRQPLRNILQTYRSRADHGELDTEKDEIDAVRKALERASGTVDALGEAVQIANDKSSELEAALQYSEERYVLAMRISDDGAWEWNLQTGQFILSPRWKCMLGYTEDDFPDSLQAWREHVHPLDLAAVDATLNCRLESHVTQFEQQFRLLHQDGRYRWVSSLGTIIRHANGKALRIVALDTDITRVKQIESVLHHIVEGTSGTGGEAFFRAMVRNFAAALEVPCAFVTECIGWPPKRVQTLAYWRRGDFVDNIEFELAGTPCEAIFDEGRPVFYSSRVRELFPREKDYESYYGIPIFGSRGHIIGHMAFFNDEVMRQEDVLTDAVYQIFTARAAAEIERKAALDRLTRFDAAEIASPMRESEKTPATPPVTNM
ncbi:PAS domain-containing protein [Trinickia symbiotica]|uniref:PAS domain-containing protein n=1 Tax=Trinickia symbiotica TaxID=863227 RepID=UPI0021596732|nr:PAS domain-containing protein [Trinickia symbiotica]